ncbi:hypothetical protein J2S30_005001 [Herbaspirillum rubrisubalbicans]|nr:hypothetical protein [Herbaspirillum rubrisubalbicans]
MPKLSTLAFALSAALLGSAAPLHAQQTTRHDEFFWLGEINKASAVINTDEGLLDKSMTPLVVKGIRKVLADGELPGAKRPTLVITFEPLLIQAAGPQITLLHAGRSSQDMLATLRAAILREDLLTLATQLNATTAALVKLARAPARHHRAQLHQWRSRPAQQLWPLPAGLCRRAGARCATPAPSLCAPGSFGHGHHGTQRQQLAAQSPAHGRLSGFCRHRRQRL